MPALGDARRLGRLCGGDHVTAALIVLVSVAAGIVLAWAYLPREPHFLALAAGSIPRWTIEHHASCVARALAGTLQHHAEQEAAVAAIRACRVITLPLDSFDPTDPRVPGHARYYLAAPRLLVAAGQPHWPRHLADGLAHAARLAALGDADNQRLDVAWFRAARSSVGCADVVLMEEVNRGRDAG